MKDWEAVGDCCVLIAEEDHQRIEYDLLANRLVTWREYDGHEGHWWQGPAIHLADLLATIPREHVADALALIDETATEGVARMVTLEDPAP